MRIWQRHILLHLIKTFLFFVFCIFFVYVIVDLSVHGIRFFAKSSPIEVAQFYLRTLATLLELFLSLGFLLATLRVLIDLNTHRELIALQMAGLSKKQLLAPFFYFAVFLSLTCYVNSQWFAPGAQDTTHAFKGAHKEKRETKIHLFCISLADESELVYQSFDEAKKELFDVFWVRSPADIWHMKTLQTDSLKGHFVHHFVPNSANQIEKKESFTSRDFPEILWDSDAALHKYTPFESRSISTLFLQARSAHPERPSIFSHLYYKLLTPLIPLLILFGTAPICMRFSRSRPLFLIAACAIFSFIALKVVLDGMLILGENQVLPAPLAIWSPILLSLALLTPSFAKMR